MPLRLKIDPRPPLYDSVTEATIAEDEGEIDDAVELGEWQALRATGVGPADLAFVDGVERREKRISAEGEGRIVPGLLASYGAGALWPSKGRGACIADVERRLILGCGHRAPSIRLRSTTACVEYLPVSSAETDFEGLGKTLNQLRATLEAKVVHALMNQGAGAIIVDGRLPPDVESPAIGLIKTPHVLPSVVTKHFEVLTGLTRGERSPVFVRRRSDRPYYCWFLCLRTPGPDDVALSGLGLLEMSGDTSLNEVRRLADLTAASLPDYASEAYQDDRAPQNLLPVGLLENELRHLLGNPDLMHRLAVEAFRREPIWC
jgi:hypothetical protein